MDRFVHLNRNVSQGGPWSQANLELSHCLLSQPGKTLFVHYTTALDGRQMQTIMKAYVLFSPNIQASAHVHRAWSGSHWSVLQTIPRRIRSRP